MVVARRLNVCGQFKAEGQKQFGWGFQVATGEDFLSALLSFRKPSHALPAYL